MLKHSLPSIDITPLRDECFAELPINLSSDFIKNAMSIVDKTDWFNAKLSHREYGESKGRPDQKVINSNPLDINTNIDKRLITRQLRSSLNLQVSLSMIGDIRYPKHKATEEINKVLKPIEEHIGALMLFRFDSDEGLIPHKDGMGGSRIYIPLHPVGEEYSRLEMYYNSDIYYVYHYEDPPKVYLFSNEVPHAVFNQGYPKRYNLQIQCKHDYKTMLKIIDKSFS